VEGYLVHLFAVVAPVRVEMKINALVFLFGQRHALLVAQPIDVIGLWCFLAGQNHAAGQAENEDQSEDE
jgi:hypothetical protein